MSQHAADIRLEICQLSELASQHLQAARYADLDPVVRAGDPGQSLYDASGRPLPNAPEWVYTLNADFVQPLGNQLELFAKRSWAPR